MAFTNRSTNRNRGLAGTIGSSVVAIGLGLSLGACTMPEKGPSTGSAEMQPDTFTFAPPDGTRGVRTEHRRYEVALIGTPLRNLEEEELKWNVEAHKSGEGYTVHQELAHVMMKQDGETMVDCDVKPGAIAADLIIDKAGNLVDVKGLEGTSKTLQSLASPEAKKAAARVFASQSLKALVASRYEETMGDIIGRPTKVGSSWTTQGRPGAAVLSRTVTVQSMEPCGGVTCARLSGSYKLDPKTMIKLASEVVKDYARWSNTAATKLDVQAAMYSMDGTLLTEPATMLNHEASLDESGKVFFAGPQRQMEIDLTGKTDITVDYAKPVSLDDTPPSRPTVATKPAVAETR